MTSEDQTPPDHLSDPELDKQYQATKADLEETRRQKAGQAEELNQQLDTKTGVPDVQKNRPLTRAIASSPGLTEEELDAIDAAQKPGGTGLTEDQLNALESAQIAKPPEPINPAKINSIVDKNLQAHLDDVKAKNAPAENAQKPSFEPPANPKVEEAKGFVDAIEKTFGASNIGMMTHGGLPTKVLPEQGDMLYRIVGQLGMAPDLLGVMLPAGIVGAFTGAGLGTIELPGAGTITGAAAGGAMNAWGTEAGLRQALVDAYSTGSAQEWKDLWPHVAANFINGYTKGAVTGLATELATGSTAIRALLAKAITMTVFGSGMEGRMPTLSSFIDNSLIFLGMHTLEGAIAPRDAHQTSVVSQKLQNIFAKTGIKPEQIVEDSKTNPALAQQILSTNMDIPESLKGKVDPKAVEAQANPELPSVTLTPKNVSPVLGEGFRPENGIEVETPHTPRKIYYHGTTEQFENFDLEKSYPATPGLHFTEDKNEAQTYAGKDGRIISAHLDIKNPLMDAKEFSGKARDDLLAKLRENGFDREAEALEQDIAEGFPNTSGHPPSIGHALADAIPGEHSGARKIKIAKALGYDAIVHSGETIVFHPDQVNQRVGSIAAGSYDMPPLDVLNDTKKLGQFLTTKDHAAFVEEGVKKNIAELEDQLPEASNDPESRKQVLSQIKDAKDSLKSIAEMKSFLPHEPGSLEGVSKGTGSNFGDQIVSTSGRKPEIKTSADMRLYLDERHPLKDLVKLLVGGKEAFKAMDALDDPYALTDLLDSTETKARNFLEEGPRSFVTRRKTGTPGLMQTLRQIPEKDFEAFREFRVAATNVERHDAGIPTGQQIEGPGGMREAYEKGKAQFEKPMLQIVEYHNDLLRYRMDAGIVSKKAGNAAISKWKYYSPMMQEFEEGQSGTPGVGGKGLNVRQTFFGLKGKELGAKIIDPFESDMRITVAAVKMAHRNEVLLKLRELQKQANELLGEHAEQLVQDAPDEGPESVTSEELHNPDKVMDLGSGKQPFFENGRRKIMIVPKEVAEALKGIPTPELGSLGKAVMIPTRLSRFTAIHNLTFPLLHAIRAETMAWVNSDLPWYHVPGTRLVKGLYRQLVSKGDMLSDAKFDGALKNRVEALDKDYISKNLYKLSKEHGIMDSIQNLVKSPAETFRLGTKIALDAAKNPKDAITAAYEKTINSAEGVVHTIVNAPRIAEYESIRKASKDPNSAKTRVEAAYTGGNIIPNGTKIGASPVVRALSRFTPFWNMEIQGKKQFIENLSDRPTTTLMRCGGLSLAAMALWYLTKDDEDVKQTPKHIADMSVPLVEHNWQPATSAEVEGYPAHRVRQGPNGMELDHKIIHRIPVPWDVGMLFMSAPSRALQSMYDEDKKEFGKPGSNEKAWDDFGYNLFKRLVFDNIPVPPAIQLPLELLANKSKLTGNPVIPRQMQGIDHDEQYMDYSSPTFIELGHFLGSLPGLSEWKKHGDLSPSSPMALQYAWNSWTGGLGRTMLTAMDHVLSKQGVYPPESNPHDDLKDLSGWSRSFEVKFPSMSANEISRLYFRLEGLAHVKATVELLNNRMKPMEGLETFMEGLRDTGISDIGKADDTIKGAIQMANMIKMDPSKSPGEKQMAIDKLTYFAIASAKMSNQILDNFQKYADTHRAEFDEMVHRMKGKPAVRAPEISPQQAPQQQDQQAPQAPQPQQAPTPAPQQIRHVKPAPQRQAPIPGTDSNWQNPALAPTHPSKAGGE